MYNTQPHFGFTITIIGSYHFHVFETATFDSGSHCTMILVIDFSYTSTILGWSPKMLPNTKFSALNHMTKTHWRNFCQHLTKWRAIDLHSYIELKNGIPGDPGNWLCKICIIILFMLYKIFVVLILYCIILLLMNKNGKLTSWEDDLQNRNIRIE